jgi:hypothetical protein
LLEDHLDSPEGFLFQKKRKVNLPPEDKSNLEKLGWVYTELKQEINDLLNYYNLYCNADCNIRRVERIPASKIVERVLDDIAYLAEESIDVLVRGEDKPHVQRIIENVKGEINQYIHFRWKPTGKIKREGIVVKSRNLPKVEVFYSDTGSDRNIVSRSLLSVSHESDYKKASISPIQMFSFLLDSNEGGRATGYFINLCDSNIDAPADAFNAAEELSHMLAYNRDTGPCEDYQILRKNSIPKEDALYLVRENFDRYSLSVYIKLRQKHSHSHKEALHMINKDINPRQMRKYIYFVSLGVEHTQAEETIDAGRRACRELADSLKQKTRS